MKVVIGLPISHGFPIPVQFFTCWNRFIQYILTNEGNQVYPDAQIHVSRVIQSDGFPVDVARNQIIKVFLDSDNGDYLFFLDADMTFEPDIVHRLLSRKKDVISGLYCMRRAPFNIVAMRKTGTGPRDYDSIGKIEPSVQGLMPIDAAGAGCLLIKRNVLKIMRQHVGDVWFKYQDGPDGNNSVSEDMWFFEQAKASGYQAWLDADVQCGHLAQFEAKPHLNQAFLELYRQAKERQQVAV